MNCLRHTLTKIDTYAVIASCKKSSASMSLCNCSHTCSSYLYRLSYSWSSRKFVLNRCNSAHCVVTAIRTAFHFLLQAWEAEVSTTALAFRVGSRSIYTDLFIYECVTKTNGYTHQYYNYRSGCCEATQSVYRSGGHGWLQQQSMSLSCHSDKCPPLKTVSPDHYQKECRNWSPMTELCPPV